MPKASDVARKQKSRSSRAKSIDSSRTSKKVIVITDQKNVGRWLKHPERYDIRGVDTKRK